MDVHNNAQLTPHARATMVARVLDHSWRYRATARAIFTTTRTVRRWVRRFEAEGQAGLHDRQCRPCRQPSRTTRRPQREMLALRRQYRAVERIAAFVGVSRATVGRSLARAGLNRLVALEPSEPPSPTTPVWESPYVGC